MRLEIPKICRYCGGVVHLVSAADVYGMAAAKRLGIEQENFYQCQNCNARVGCHKGTTRPLGNLANEALRMKRKETHQIFDSFWRERGMTRTQGYHWMAKKLRLSEQLAHIGGFEMDRCQRLIDLCEKERNKEAAYTPSGIRKLEELNREMDQLIQNRLAERKRIAANG